MNSCSKRMQLWAQGLVCVMLCWNLMHTITPAQAIDVELQTQSLCSAATCYATEPGNALAESMDAYRDKICSKLLKLQKNSDIRLLNTLLLRFESRMLRKNGQRKLGDCYKSISSALEQYERAGDESGAMLVRHLIVELANPSEVNQGNHNTCALAALQSLLYENDPVRVCDLVFQAHSGHLQLNDGRIMEMPATNTEPDRESRFFRSGSTFRSYAAQLFQVAAANLFWQSQTKNPRGITVPRGSVNYIQDYSSSPMFTGDTRERLIVNWSTSVKEIVAADDNMPETSPSFTIKSIAETYQLLTGQTMPQCLLSHKKNHSNKPAIGFASEKDLSKQLQRLKEEGALPAIISVSGSGEILAAAHRLTPMNGEKTLPQPIFLHPQGNWHVVCINDYDQESGKVAVDNFWGPADDHLEDKAINIHALYLSSCPSQISAASQVSILKPGFH